MKLKEYYLFASENVCFEFIKDTETVKIKIRDEKSSYPREKIIAHMAKHDFITQMEKILSHVKRYQ